MPVLEPNPVEEKKSKEESTAVKKKKRKMDSEKGKRKSKSDSQEYLEMETAGDVNREEDLETARRLAKKSKAGKGKLRGDNGFDGDFGSVSEKKAFGLNMVVGVELDQKKGKKEKKKRKKDAIELEELGDGGFVDKKKMKKIKKADKDTMELEEPDNVDIGEGDDRIVCESEKCSVTLEEGKQDDILKGEDKKKMKKKKKKSDKDTMELEEPANVDISEGDDRVVRESEKCAVTLEEGKQDDMLKGEEKKRKGKKKKKEGDNVAQDVGQNTLAIGDVKSGNKERKKSEDKKKAGEMGKEKVAHRKDKGKRVSFTDAVEVFNDGVDDEESDKGGVDDEESDQDSESKLVHGKRFTAEEDAKIMEALMNYAEMKQLGEKGIEMIRTSKKHPELRGCWTEITKALPHRPYNAVYKRARILLYRSDARKYSEEEYEIIRRFVEKNGPNWIKLAAELGKSEIHVKDTWRRIKPKNLRKGYWTQEEYQNLFDLVNLDLRLKAHQQFDHGHRMIRENIAWGAISDKLTTRGCHDCCLKWYQQLASPMVKQGVWGVTDDYLLVEALQKVDAVCIEDVDWDNLLDHRSGELCRQRWNQMVRHLGGHREKSFIEQVEVLSRRYSPEMLDYRKGEVSDLPPTTPSAPTLDG